MAEMSYFDRHDAANIKLMEAYSEAVRVACYPKTFGDVLMPRSCAINLEQAGASSELIIALHDEAKREQASVRQRVVQLDSPQPQGD